MARVSKGKFEAGANAVNKMIKGKGGYGTPNAEDLKKSTGWQNTKMSYDDGGMFGRANKMGGMIRGNWEEAALDKGKSVLGMAGSYAIKGAAGGAVVGGTIEAAQGGSFWDGAKQGAFNGAALATGYGMGMKGVGASSLNPLAKQVSKDSKGGLLSSGSTMWRSTKGDAEISGQARAIMNQRQMEGVARSFMHQRKRDAKA